MCKKYKGKPVYRNLKVGKVSIRFNMLLQIETDNVKDQYAGGNNQY